MSRYRTKGQSPRQRAGFTLVELMVTVAVLAILAMIATPAMQDLIDANRLAGASSDLQASLQLARSEAVRRNSRVTICPSSNGVACSAAASWSRFIVHGLDKTAAPPVDDVIRDSTLAGGVSVSGPAAGIAFKPSGLIDSSQQLEVTMASNKRCVSVLISGAMSIKKGAC